MPQSSHLTVARPVDQPSAAADRAGAYDERGDVGFQHSLSNLQVQMIAIGGAVGVGLFLGLGEPLRAVGPGLVLSYLVVSVVVYLLMRALGEMVVYRPSTGAFVSYAREFVGPRFAHMTGWIYVSLAALAGITEVAAIAVYTSYWFPAAPDWVSSVLALALIVGSNLLTVRAFGLIETAASAIKVVAIVLFLAVGLVVVLFGDVLGWESRASVDNLWSHGGFLPHGVWPVVIVMQAVVFSYSAVEITANAAGEAKDPQRSIPTAIRGVMVRMGLFYLGSILVLAMLLPTSSYSGEESPFVTALASLDVPYLGDVMNFVVLSAALSGVNATLYATVRLLRNLAAHGSAPRATVWISRGGVPVGSLLCMGGFYLVGVVLILFAGAGTIFSVALGSAAVCILFGWMSIFYSHLRFRAQVAQGTIAPVAFRMPGAPYTNWACLAVLAALFVTMVFDVSRPHWYYSLVAVAVLVALHATTYELARRRVARNGLPDVAPRETTHA